MTVRKDIYRNRNSLTKNTKTNVNLARLFFYENSFYDSVYIQTLKERNDNGRCKASDLLFIFGSLFVAKYQISL